MQETPDPSAPPRGKPTDWIPITIALGIFVAAAIKVLFFTTAPEPPTEPLKRPSTFKDTVANRDTPADHRYQ